MSNNKYVVATVTYLHPSGEFGKATFQDIEGIFFHTSNCRTTEPTSTLLQLTNRKPEVKPNLQIGTRIVIRRPRQDSLGRWKTSNWGMLPLA